MVVEVGCGVNVDVSSASEPDIRTRLSRLLDVEISDEKLRGLIADALTSEKQREVSLVCNKCRQRIVGWVKVADMKERFSGLEILLNQGKGKPRETVAHTVTVRALPLRELSDEELRAIASGAAE